MGLTNWDEPSPVQRQRRTRPTLDDVQQLRAIAAMLDTPEMAMSHDATQLRLLADQLETFLPNLRGPHG